MLKVTNYSLTEQGFETGCSFNRKTFTRLSSTMRRPSLFPFQYIMPPNLCANQ